MNKNNKFLAYIKNTMTVEKVSLILTSNNITHDKCMLYGDFTQSLLMKVFDTYMGDDFTCLDEQFNHFKWCWDKTIEDFKEEGIFLDGLTLYEYYLEFCLEVFYCFEEKDDEFFIEILGIWKNLFNMSNQKTQSEVDTLIELYLIFEKALKKV